MGSRRNLSADPVAEELQGLLPEAEVCGGCFSHLLPSLTEVPARRRAGELRRATKAATSVCLQDLLVRAGLPAIEPRNRSSGEREWPSGYAGSVSHKGTKVVAALAPIGPFWALGVDIETADPGNLADVPSLRTSPDLPPDLTLDTALPVLFSVKEAAFKALFPLVREPVAPGDTRVSWGDDCSTEFLHGTTRFRGWSLVVRCSTVVPAWVVSCALARRL